jgi:hypothetical protein
MFGGAGHHAGGGGPGAGDMEKLHAECEQHKKAAHELAKVARTAKQEVNKPTHFCMVFLFFIVLGSL